jgi:hypothetical protein
MEKGIRPRINDNEITMSLNSKLPQVSNWRFRLAADSTVSIEIMSANKVISSLLH